MAENISYARAAESFVSGRNGVNIKCRPNNGINIKVARTAFLFLFVDN